MVAITERLKAVSASKIVLAVAGGAPPVVVIQSASYVVGTVDPQRIVSGTVKGF